MLSGNALKLIALISMTIDHIGVVMFPGNQIFRAVGRLALPIFAYMIAEGCRYTHSRPRYILTVFLVGVFCQAVYLLAERSVEQCILITFTFSILIICSFDLASKDKRYIPVMLCLIVFAYFIAEKLPSLLPSTDFSIDYGFFGIMLAPLIYIGTNRPSRLVLTAVGLVFVALVRTPDQWLSLLSLPLLALYNGKRGFKMPKYFFYAYYPLHLGIIYIINFIIS